MSEPDEFEVPRRARYETTLDRAGAAVAAGGGTVGLIACILIAADRDATPGAVILALPVGALLGAFGIVAVGGLPWLLLHLVRRRGPVAATLLGAGLALLIFLASQTGGFGLGLAPEDTQTTLYRWASAGLTSLVMALLGGAIALLMWRVGYRRSG